MLCSTAMGRRTRGRGVVFSLGRAVRVTTAILGADEAATLAEQVANVLPSHQSRSLV